MVSLKPRHERFCRAYALAPNGAKAARTAGYRDSNARQQASRLLNRPDIAARLGELWAERDAKRDSAAAHLIERLDPIYWADLETGRTARVMQIVELQARIAGLLSGDAAIVLAPESAPGRPVRPSPLPSPRPGPRPGVDGARLRRRPGVAPISTNRAQASCDDEACKTDRHFGGASATKPAPGTANPGIWAERDDETRPSGSLTSHWIGETDD